MNKFYKDICERMKKIIRVAYINCICKSAVTLSLLGSRKRHIKNFSNWIDTLDLNHKA